MLPILVLMIDSDRFVTNFGPKNHATWPFLSMPWALIRGWAIIQVWAINRDFTYLTSKLDGTTKFRHMAKLSH